MQKSPPHTPPLASWAAANLVRDAWARFRAAALALPREAWTRWLRVLLTGLAITCLVSLALTLWGIWAEPRGLAAWDERQLQAIIAAEPITIARAIVLESPGNPVGMYLLMVIAVPFAIFTARPLVAASIGTAYGFGVIVFYIGWGLWSRSRPELVFDGALAPGLHSFPSGHMVHCTAIYGYLTFVWCNASRSWLERALAVVILAAGLAAVGTARLVMGTHWPTDIMGGVLLGSMLAVTFSAAHSAAERRAAHVNLERTPQPAGVR